MVMQKYAQCFANMSMLTFGIGGYQFNLQGSHIEWFLFQTNTSWLYGVHGGCKIK
jgi:hypothetical protein